MCTNSPVPIRKSGEYTTEADNQPNIEIEVFQGESEMVFLIVTKKNYFNNKMHATLVRRTRKHLLLSLLTLRLAGQAQLQARGVHPRYYLWDGMVDLLGCR